MFLCMIKRFPACAFRQNFVVPVFVRSGFVVVVHKFAGRQAVFTLHNCAHFQFLGRLVGDSIALDMLAAFAFRFPRCACLH